MNKFIMTGAAVFIVIFGMIDIHSDLSIVDDFEETKVVAAIIKAYPESDERHQFVIAMRKVGGLLTATASEEDFFLAFRAFPLIKPFLKSQNDKIKVCAEDMMRFIKSGIRLQLLTEPPDDASYEDVKRSITINTQAGNKAMTSYTFELLKIESRRAADTLVQLLEENNPPAVKRAAANDILNYVLKFREDESSALFGYD